MAIKNQREKQEEASLQCQKVWFWLRELPMYIQDYQRFIKTKSYRKFRLSTKLTDELSLKKKWGFFPLIDPIHIDAPIQMRQTLAFLDESPYEEFVRLSSKKLIGRAKGKILPKWIPIEVNIDISKGILVKEFHDLVKALQFVAGIIGKRPRHSSFFELYVTHIGTKYLNWSQSQLKKALNPRSVRAEQKAYSEGFRRKVSRLQKKLGA